MRWYRLKPKTTSWALLATAMVAMVIGFGLDAGLTLREHAFLVAVTVLLAGLCTWMVFLERDSAETTATTPAANAPTARPALAIDGSTRDGAGAVPTAARPGNGRPQRRKGGAPKRRGGRR